MIVKSQFKIISNDTIYTIIVPEPHINDKNFTSRIDYVSEIKDYMELVKNLIIEYSQQGETNVIFIGDIFHREFSIFSEYIYWHAYFLELRTYARLFSVIGNHELSYYQLNPFWYLVKNIDSEYVQSISRYATSGLSELGLLEIPDRIQINNTLFSLGHWLSKPKPVEGLFNVGLFHGSFIEKEIANILKNRYNRDPLEHYMDYSYIGSNEYFKGYDHIHNGHMHRAFGLFTIAYDDDSKTRLRYLGSIGRTNVTEVSDEDLDRVIPIYTIKGSETFLEEYSFKLKPRAEVVNEIIVKRNKEKYAIQKEGKRITDKLLVTDDPIKDIKGIIKDHKLYLEIFNNSIVGVESDLYISLRKEILKKAEEING